MQNGLKQKHEKGSFVWMQMVFFYFGKGDNVIWQKKRIDKYVYEIIENLYWFSVVSVVWWNKVDFNTSNIDSENLYSNILEHSLFISVFVLNWQ